MDALKKITILFGTQTGNSEDVAERIGRQMLRMGCRVRVSNFADFPAIRLLKETRVIFVCSTTGNGEFPDDMKAFWRHLLRKNLPSDSLSHLSFCIFGLGDSSYDKFNVVAKKLSKRLQQLGAAEFIPLALADDQHELGYDAALDPWMSRLRENLKELFDLSKDSFLPADVLLPPRYRAIFESTEDQDLEGTRNVSQTTGETINQSENLDASQLIATLRKNTTVTAKEHFQAVHLLEFEIGNEVRYSPGDVAVVWPKNSTEDVKEFLALLNVSPETAFHLEPSNPTFSVPKTVPQPCTPRQCAYSLFDFKSVPRRSFFEFFHHFSRDETEKEKLMEFTTALGQEELYDYCNRPRRNILEVLKDFPHTTPHVSFDYLFDMIPSIRPRHFSIASSVKSHPGELHLLVAVVKYRTRLVRPRTGLCSSWITSLQPGATVPYSLKKGSIQLPTSDVPIVCVGPGTGCAPFRSFVEERALDGIGDNVLFFGCRYREKDFLFRETWEELEARNMLRLFTAFSRDQEDKVYVQHRIVEEGPLLWELIHAKKGVVYVAGNAKQMPQGVREAFLEVFEREGCLNREESAACLQAMEVGKRYQVETWT